LRKKLNDLLEKIKDSYDEGKAAKEEYLTKLKDVREQMKDLKVDIGDKAKELLQTIKEKANEFWQKILDKLKHQERSVDKSNDSFMTPRP